MLDLGIVQHHSNTAHRLTEASSAVCPQLFESSWTKTWQEIIHRNVRGHTSLVTCLLTGLRPHDKRTDCAPITVPCNLCRASSAFALQQSTKTFTWHQKLTAIVQEALISIKLLLQLQIMLVRYWEGKTTMWYLTYCAQAAHTLVDQSSRNIRLYWGFKY
jgi:hypothetical protein